MSELIQCNNHNIGEEKYISYQDYSLLKHLLKITDRGAVNIPGNTKLPPQCVLLPLLQILPLPDIGITWRSNHYNVIF